MLLVVGPGFVRAEEEDEHAFATVGGALEGFPLEAFDEFILGAAPGLGEFGVLIAPAVKGGHGDSSPAGGFSYGSAPMMGLDEPLLLSCAVVRR